MAVLEQLQAPRFRLLHFSDPHVQLRGWRTRSLRALGPLRALATIELWKGRGTNFDDAAGKLRELARLARGFDHAVCTGDLVQLGTQEEFALAREALGALAAEPARFTCLPGNHDRYPDGRSPQRWYEESFPEQVQSDLGADFLRTRFVGDTLALVATDSTGPLSWPVLSPGRISADDVQRLTRTLAHPEVRRRCALVLAHHAPFQPRPFGLLQPIVFGGGPFLRACRAGGAQALLCGHVHQRYQLNETRARPRILCVGSSTEAGKEGAFALEIEQNRLVSVRVVELSAASPAP